MLTHSRSHQPLSPIFSPLIQHSSMRFKPGDTECILSAVARMFSSPAISCAGRHSRQQTYEPAVISTTKGRRWRFKMLYLHPHLSNENTKLGLVEPPLHHFLSTCDCLHAALFCVWIPACAGVCLHMCVSGCVKPKWHVLDDVTLPQSCRWRHLDCWWCTDTSAAWCPFLTDELTCTGGSVCLSGTLSLWLCHHFHWAWITNDSWREFRLQSSLRQNNFLFHISSSLP